MKDLDQIARDFDRVFESLSRVELQRGAGSLESMELQDLFKPGEGLFLGFYTEDGLRHAFEEYGFISDIVAAGFDEVRVEIVTDDPDEHMLRIWAREDVGAPLVELVARRDILRPTLELADVFGDPVIPVLTIEWLQMQNPRAEFSATRPPLPGQRYPGLGVGVQVLQLLRNACRRLGLEALVTVPAYFHNAMFYSEAFAYFDPSYQGRFLAMTRDILPQAFASVAAASWALQWKMVVRSDKDDEPVEWFHDAMVSPVSERLQSFFDSRLFQREVNDSLTRASYRVLEDVLRDQLCVRGIQPFDAEAVESWISEHD